VRPVIDREHRAALFDLDGVLVNTEPLKLEAHEDVARSLGSTQPSHFYREVLGQTKNRVARRAIEIAKLGVSVDEYNRRFDEFYRSKLGGRVTLTPGAAALLRDLRDENYYCGVVSSSSRAVAQEILRLVGLSSAFDVIVTAESMTSPKPSPAPYRAALNALSVAPARAVAFEDTEAGLQAARRAGLVVIAILHDLNSMQDLSAASAQLHDFVDHEAVVDLINSLTQAKESS
jgi:HAD superfamily hydrolase (TIGR01509 family)